MARMNLVKMPGLPDAVRVRHFHPNEVHDFGGSIPVCPACGEAVTDKETARVTYYSGPNLPSISCTWTVHDVCVPKMPAYYARSVLRQ